MLKGREFEVKIERMRNMLTFQIAVIVAMKWLCETNRISECSKCASHINLNDKKTKPE